MLEAVAAFYENDGYTRIMPGKSDCESVARNVHKQKQLILCNLKELYFTFDDVVLHHTLPIFMGLGQCPIVSWDFAGAVSIFWIRCPSCHPPMTFIRIRTCELLSESCSS